MEGGDPIFIMSSGIKNDKMFFKLMQARQKQKREGESGAPKQYKKVNRKRYQRLSTSPSTGGPIIEVIREFYGKIAYYSQQHYLRNPLDSNITIYIIKSLLHLMAFEQLLNLKIS